MAAGAFYCALYILSFCPKKMLRPLVSLDQVSTALAVGRGPDAAPRDARRPGGVQRLGWRRWLAVAWLAGLLVPVVEGSQCGAGTYYSTNYSILMDPSYIDTGQEGQNLRNAMGHSPTTFSSLSTLISSLGNNPPPEVVVIPEQEKGSISLSSAQRTLVAEYVDGGGRLVVASCGGSTETGFLNSIFGWSMSSDSCTKTTRVKTEYGFGDGPSSLPTMNAIHCIATSTLPSGASSVYESSGGAASV